MTTLADLDIPHLETWIGREEVAQDIVENLCSAFVNISNVIGWVHKFAPLAHHVW